MASQYLAKPAGYRNPKYKNKRSRAQTPSTSASAETHSSLRSSQKKQRVREHQDSDSTPRSLRCAFGPPHILTPNLTIPKDQRWRRELCKEEERATDTIPPHYPTPLFHLHSYPLSDLRWKRMAQNGKLSLDGRGEGRSVVHFQIPSERKAVEEPIFSASDQHDGVACRPSHRAGE